jgi:hypothetical protein
MRAEPEYVTFVAVNGFIERRFSIMIERREYIDRIKAAMDVWSDELRHLEEHVIQGDPGMTELWEDQRQELQRLLLAVQDNITCLRLMTRPDMPRPPGWQQVRCDLKSLTDRLYAGN